MQSPGKELAKLIRKHASEAAERGQIATGLELGTITQSGLKLDGFKHEITDYLLAEHLTLAADYMTETTQDNPEPGTHNHRVITPNQLKPLSAGDRVIVAPIGADFIVLARVVENA